MNSTEPKKSYSIDFQDRGRFLCAHIKGERGSLEIASAYWKEIAEKTLESGFKRLLVVEDIAEMISIAEVHHL